VPRPTAVAEVTSIPEVLSTDDGYVLESKTITVSGKSFTFRELTVSEMDLCREAATDDEKFDSIKMVRMMVVTSSVKPELRLEDIEKMPSRLYSHLWSFVNDLNDPDALSVKEGNA
jgi:hypothetical protein